MEGAVRHARAIRRIVLLAGLSTIVVALRVLTIPVAWISRPHDRQILEGLIRCWGAGAGLILAIRCTTRGELPRSPTLLVSNHLSYLDVVVFSRRFGGHFVAKSEVGAWPGVGLLARLAGTIFVDRKRKRDLLRVIAAMTEGLEQGRSVLFFPEATSSPGVAVLPFHSSLFESAQRSGAPVAVASLRYATDAHDESAADAVCWWGDMTFPDHAYRLLGLPQIHATLCFGAVELRGRDRKALTRVARDELVKIFEPCAGSERYRGSRIRSGLERDSAIWHLSPDE